MYYCIAFPIQNWIELREDRSHTGIVHQPALVGAEGGEQIVAAHQSQLEAMPGFFFVGRQNFQRPFVVGRHQQIVGILMSEVTIQTGEMQLDQVSHAIIGRVVRAV